MTTPRSKPNGYAAKEQELIAKNESMSTSMQRALRIYTTGCISYESMQLLL